MSFLPLHLLLVVMVSFALFVEGANDCRESRCSSHGPSIHFPFRLQHQPEHCGYPGFELSCYDNETMLTLSDSLKVSLCDIDYISQQIALGDDWGSRKLSILHFNFSASPFHLNNELPLCNYSVFNCSNSHSGLIPLSNIGFVDNHYNHTGCKKIYEIPSAPCFQQSVLWIDWLNPPCGYCEGLGMDCGFKNYTNELTIQCSDSITKGTNDCGEPRCHNGPIIRFPFRLQQQPEHCGYPGFELSCYDGQTMLALSDSVIVSVWDIDYVSQQIELEESLGSCEMSILRFNFSVSPFHLNDDELCNFSILNCSGRMYDDRFNSRGCIANTSDSVLVTLNDGDRLKDAYTSCEKIDEIPSVPCVLGYASFSMSWLTPQCGNCEDLGKDCGFENYTKELSIRCFDRPSITKGGLKEPLIAGGVLGLILVGIIMMAFYGCYSSSKTERKNQARVEKFLEDYRALRPTRYTYAVIKKITYLFQERLGEGAYGVVYKGTLSDEIHVAVKVLNDSKGNGEEFINEVAAMGKLHHVNVVRLVGFCADGFSRVLVYEYLPNQSLDKLIFQASYNNQIILNWKKLQDIAMGIAKGLEYLHQRCDQQILHFDIKPQNILLDHNLNPKISDFGLAKLCSKEKSAVTMTEARGTMGYIAPEVLSSNFGKASHKSDVYSFGMLLLEMVGGKKNFDANANVSQRNFPEWIHQQLNQGEELRIRIEEDDDIIIVRKLAIIGLWCIQWNATDRPSIKVVTQMLEGDGSDLTIPPLFTARRTNHAGAGATASPSGEVLTVILEE